MSDENVNIEVKELTDITIDEVSLVEDPANPEADILSVKSREEDGIAALRKEAEDARQALQKAQDEIKVFKEAEQEAIYKSHGQKWDTLQKALSVDFTDLYRNIYKGDKVNEVVGALDKIANFIQVLTSTSTLTQKMASEHDEPVLTLREQLENKVKSFVDAGNDPQAARAKAIKELQKSNKKFLSDLRREDMTA